MSKTKPEATPVAHKEDTDYKFYLSLTDENGVLIDRFRLELAGGMAMEDSEGVGHPIANADLADRLRRCMLQYIKVGRL